LQDELVNLRAKLSEILEENKRLHEELKTSILQEIVGENIDLEAAEVSMGMFVGYSMILLDRSVGRLIGFTHFFSCT
jgi:hypothetical protein